MENPAWAVNDLISLEVKTYTADDIEDQTWDPNTGNYTGSAKLRAQTRIALYGDIVHIVPERAAEDGKGNKTVVEIEEQLWRIHKEKVETAQTSRVKFVKTLAEVVEALLKVGG